MRRRSSSLPGSFAAATSALVVLGFAMVAATANAASLQKVNQSDWWAGTSGLPSYVNMYAYVPDGLATNPPIVVAPHHCQGTAQSTYSEMASLLSIADKTGFLVIFPEATGENCWDAGSMRSLTHGGGGDTGAVVQMVKYALSKYGANAARVYSVGGSSGGIMTEALLGVYPDVFMAGVSLMGVPCGCWAQGYSDVTGTGSTAQWSGSCASGDVSKTGQAWGDLVRSYYPGYTGHRPRLQHWHGTADTTLNFKNLAEDVKEWTNLLGLSETPTGSDTPKSGTAHQFWKNSCGYTVYETFSLSGVAHAVPFDGNAVAAYFGLDSAGATDPEATACGGGGMGGTGAGPGGMGGRSASDAGGAGPNGGRAGGRAREGKGGMSGTAGDFSSGGAAGTNPGGSGSGALGGLGGNPHGSGGASAAGAPQGVAAGATGSGGAGRTGVGGSMTGGASSGDGGRISSGDTPSSKGSGDGGCACMTRKHAGGTFPIAAAFALAALSTARRRRGRREFSSPAAASSESGMSPHASVLPRC